VESGFSDACFFEQVLPCLVVGLRVERMPVGLGEHEPVVFPQRAGGDAFLFLDFLVDAEQVDQRSRDGDGAPARFRFHIVENQATTLTLWTPACVSGAVRGTRPRTGELVPPAP